MYQSLYTRSATTHPYLYLLGSSGYKEGWAQYVEIYSGRFFGADDTAMTYYSSSTLLDVYLMARIDVGVNYEGWDADTAADYLNELMGLPLVTADSLERVVEICIADPGYPLPYALGYYNTNSVLETMRMKNPSLSEQEIFATYLNAMPVSFEMIEASIDRQLGK